MKSRGACVPRLTLFAVGARLFVRAAYNLKDWEMNSSTRREVADKFRVLIFVSRIMCIAIQHGARPGFGRVRASGLTVAGVTRATGAWATREVGCKARTVPATVDRRLCRTPPKVLGHSSRRGTGKAARATRLSRESGNLACIKRRRRPLTLRERASGLA